jgi:ABC-type transport system substrate-binding protein
VKWHDGASLNPTDVLTALEGVAPKYRLRLEGDTLEINAGDPAPDLLAELATSEGWAIRRPSAALPGEPLIGTGPFRLVEWQPERRAVFHAHEEYWAGRPYVDRIEVEMGRSSRDLLLDLELDRADLVELDPVEARRAQQEGKRVWTSASVKLLALRFASDGAWAQDSRLREAVARSVDRAAIQKVLLQNYGETASNIFPQWLSGYAFLFPVTADLERARQLKAEIGAPSPQRLGFDPTDPLARQVAERVAVNARDAGFSLQVAPLPDAREGADASSDLVILRRRIDGPTLQIAARQARRWFPFEDGSFDSPEAVYSAEKRLLDTFVVVPIVCIPEMVGLGPRVRNWMATPWGEWHLDEVWLEAERP